jgi:hypothetical protein
MTDQWGPNPPPPPPGPFAPGGPVTPTPPPPKRRRPGLLGWIGIAAAVLVILIAIGIAAGGSGSKRPAGATAAPATTLDLQPDTTEPPVTTEPEASTEHTIGDTVIFEDGVKMTVLGLNKNAGTTYPEDYHGQQIVVVTGKVTNGSDAAIDLVVTLSLAYGTDGTDAEAVFDTAKGYDAIQSPAKLQPGRSATGKFAFAVPKGRVNHLSFEGSPTFEHENQTWTE